VLLAVRGSINYNKLREKILEGDALVNEAVKLHIAGEREQFSNIAIKSKDAIEELLNITACLREHVFKVNPSLLFDLQKFHAEAWAIVEAFKKEFLMGQFTKNIVRGIAEGFYRPEIDPKIIAIIRIETVQFAFDERVFPRSEYDFQTVQLQMMDHFTHGLLSDKGRETNQHYHQVAQKSTN
jgi:hypothetical protein